MMTESYDAIERDVGICEYLTKDEPGFAAVVKARYSDFIVHEVNRKGEMARLDSMEPIQDEDTKANQEKETAAAAEHEKEQQQSRKRKHPETDTDTAPTNSNPPADSTPADDIWDTSHQQLVTWIGASHANQVIEMLKFWETNPDLKTHDTMTKSVKLPLIEDKESRKAIHQWIRGTLAPYARGDTQDGGRICIWHKRFEREMPNFGKFDRPGKARTERTKASSSWPTDRPDFLQFVLYKENMDTTMATRDIVKRIKGKARLGYAGMKDKRGVTTQFCTLYRKRPEDILSLNKNNNSRHGTNGGGQSTYGSVSVVRVGSFKYVQQELTLGMLQGNRFDVVLRNVDTGHADLAEKKASVEKAAKAFQEHGFINYFGMQRFGKDHDTHKVGIEILQGNFKEAIDMIMRPKPDEQPRTNIAREQWRDRFNKEDTTTESDEEKCKEIEKDCAARVLKQMGRFMTCEIAVLNSLKRDPLNYRKAFSHIPKQTRLMFLHAVQSVIWNQVATTRIAKLGQTVQVGDLVQSGDMTEEEGGSGTSGRKGKVVQIVSKADIDAGTFNMTHVVLPMVGTKITYPENEVAQLFESLLSSWGITKDSFEKIQDRELSLGGDYRKVICKPTDVDFTISEYYDPLQPLIQTDLMKINQQNLLGRESEKDERIPLVGIVVGFTLPPSSYATIALRELTKRPTSSEYQRSLKLEGPCEGTLVLSSST